MNSINEEVVGVKPMSLGDFNGFKQPNPALEDRYKIYRGNFIHLDYFQEFEPGTYDRSTGMPKNKVQANIHHTNMVPLEDDGSFAFMVTDILSSGEHEALACIDRTDEPGTERAFVVVRTIERPDRVVFASYIDNVDEQVNILRFFGLYPY